MKKLHSILCIMLLTLVLTSCNSDDDSNQNTTSSLVNTIWKGRDNALGGTYTFSTETEFTYVDSDGPIDGTYTFDGTTGVLTPEIGITNTFSISGGIMEIERPNTILIYVRQ